MKIAIIDNYDSFTYNIAHLVNELGAEVTVMRNDKFALEQLAGFDKLILSPGPGIPQEAGMLLEVIAHYHKQKPILGICLGHQAIGTSFGAQLTNLSNVFHGVTSQCHLTSEYDYIFQDIDPIFTIGRYHSWIIDSDHLPSCLAVTAVDDEGKIMAVKHREFDIHGIQFHPESILTPDGKQIVRNWLFHHADQ